jgi:hypothetical protein
MFCLGASDGVLVLALMDGLPMTGAMLAPGRPRMRACGSVRVTMRPAGAMHIAVSMRANRAARRRVWRGKMCAASATEHAATAASKAGAATAASKVSAASTSSTVGAASAASAAMHMLRGCRRSGDGQQERGRGRRKRLD